MARKKNLISLGDRPEEERKKIARKAGIASGKARREKRDMRETALAILDLPIIEGDVVEITSLAKVKGKNVTVQEAIVLAQVMKAMRGDTAAAAFCRDTSGQKPVDKVQADVNKADPFDGLTTEELKALISDDK